MKYKRKHQLVKRSSGLRGFNNFLTVVVVGLGMYIIALPFLPHINLWLLEFRDNTDGVQYAGQLAELNGVESDNLAAPPAQNTLVVPGIQVDETVLEGADIGVLGDGGVWRRPKTSTPDQGGNTVMVAHRFSYSDPSTFFHLDKMTQNDVFVVWWEGEEYLYEVFDVVEVPATAIEIEGPTEEPILTLYTCTPVWTALNRLVVKARLVNTDVLDEAPPAQAVNAALEGGVHDGES